MKWGMCHMVNVVSGTKPCKLFTSERRCIVRDYSILDPMQCAKKVMSDSPGLVDLGIGLVNSVLNLPDEQVKIFWRIKIAKVL